MSGLDLYFSLKFSDPGTGGIAAPIEYELTHQLMLYMLFQKTDLAIHLLGTQRRPKPDEVQWEPARGYESKPHQKGSVKFDLIVKSDNKEYCIEIKVLHESLAGGQKGSQFQRYTEYLQNKKEKAQGYYVSLGGADKRKSESRSSLKETEIGWRYLGHKELDDALQKIQKQRDPHMEELISAYRNALEKLRQRHGGISPPSHP